jgi:hypothetical protein
VQDGEFDLRIRERGGSERLRFELSLLRTTGDCLANGRLLRDPLQLVGEDLAVKRIVGDRRCARVQEACEQSVVHHDRFAERERKVRVAVLDVAAVSLAVLVERPPALGVLVILARVPAGLLPELPRVLRHLARESSHQVAHRLVRLELLRDLHEREGPSLLAGGCGLGVAELEKLALGHVAADGFGERASVLREHVGRRHDLQDAGVLQERDRVASRLIRADRRPGTDRVEDDQLVEVERRHLE